MYPPPTPTPLAYAVHQYVTINPNDWAIWQFADESINYWNYYHNLGLVIQIAIIVIMVIAFVVLMIRLIQQTMNEN